MKTLVTATLATALLAGCSNIAGMQVPGMDITAGSQTDRGDFGNSTMNNMLIQTGQADYTINLQRRFNAEVPDTINFAFNSSQLDNEARQILSNQATWIKQFPEVKFKVFGHTDLVGGDAFNRRLGLRRAQAAVNYLVSQGISRSRLQAVVTLGETQPVVPTQNRERRNRRTVTEVSGFVRNHPTVLNGKYAEVIFREYISSAVPPSSQDTAQLRSFGPNSVMIVIDITPNGFVASCFYRASTSGFRES